MKYKYDAETDILVIRLRGEKPDFAEQEGEVITHYNKQSKPVEIEILNASETALEIVRAMISHRKIAVRA
ncbi:MAG: DUF2283 domain-containing protein [Candidatus Diapherotrites archaeon]|nr:DUF2283 domain-containing protein [Candidatus Micrarchaeota archaeon]MBU1939379.1 DUF2283 domain-containing protein [Candidatus Micrarchaeota archaeon]